MFSIKLTGIHAPGFKYSNIYLKYIDILATGLIAFRFDINRLVGIFVCIIYDINQKKYAI